MSVAQTRNTKQRAAIRDVFERATRPLSVADVLGEAADHVDGLGVATVYRAINTLLEEEWVEAVEIPGEPVRYEKTGKGHHHHFQCERCDRLFDIEGCIENLRKLLPPKFVLNGHAVTLYGLCALCQPSRKDAARR